MSIEFGNEVYSVDHADAYAKGMVISGGSLNDAKDEIEHILFDRAGDVDIEAFLEPLSDEGYEVSNLFSALTQRNKKKVRIWQLGEAVARLYLETHHLCKFPWPSSRDVKNPNSSLPGADLVGICQKGGNRFIFGEVKTSSEKRSPPTVMTGAAGMENQLRNISTKEYTLSLIKYLLIRKNGYEREYSEALKAFLGKGEYYLAGVLIRDVDPNIKDLSRRVYNLSRVVKGKNTSLILLSLYFPKDSLRNLNKVLSN